MRPGYEFLPDGLDHLLIQDKLGALAYLFCGPEIGIYSGPWVGGTLKYSYLGHSDTVYERNQNAE